jgi:thymidylate synthase (FAD)
MSARYIPLPDENYMPSLDRLLDGANTPTANKQAQGKVGLTIANAAVWMDRLDRLYDDAQQLYADGIEVGIPKELARLPVPVARYSRMRASANLRNWLGFLALRGHPTAQWEIQQYAQAVAELVHEHFPRTMNLFTAEQARNQS